MSTAAIRRRLERLEAVVPDDRMREHDERQRRFGEAVASLMDAHENWRASLPPLDPPYYTGRSLKEIEAREGPRRMDCFFRTMLERVDAGTLTDADRAVLAAVPPCHLTPEEVLRAIVEFESKL